MAAAAAVGAVKGLRRAKMALTYGAPEGFGMWQVAELTPTVYHTASLPLHIANV